MLSFTLKTSSGTLSYNGQEYANYTDFVRIVIQLLLSFDLEVDEDFASSIKAAISGYDSDKCESGFDNDFVIFKGTNEIEEEKVRSEQARKEANERVSSLPSKGNLQLQILSLTNENPSKNWEKKGDVASILNHQANLPPDELFDAANSQKPFCLPAAEAKKVYVALRELGVVLSIKEANQITTKKKMVAKKRSRLVRKTGQFKKNSKKPNIAPFRELTGKEKLSIRSGLI